MKLTLQVFVSQVLTSHPGLKVLALVVEQFWHVYWISYCKNAWSAKVKFLHLFVLVTNTFRKMLAKKLAY